MKPASEIAEELIREWHGVSYPNVLQANVALMRFIAAAIEAERADFESERERLRKQNQDSANKRNRICANEHLHELNRYKRLNQYSIDVLGKMEFHPTTRIAINSYSSAQRAAVANLIADNERLAAKCRAMEAVVEAAKAVSEDRVIGTADERRWQKLRDALAAADAEKENQVK